MTTTTILLLANVLLAGLGVLLLLSLLRRPAGPDLRPVVSRLDGVDRAFERVERMYADEADRGRSAVERQCGELRRELGDLLRVVQKDSGERLEVLRSAVESKLGAIQTDNAARLDEMRRTVDEKLQGTLEKRLGESFRLVSERLEAVAKGLGEMQTLANGVGDLKRVLTNVKTRGTWGEVLLAQLLEQVLAPGQFQANVAVRPGSREFVEFAIRLPGPGDAGQDGVWLPIDSKFPMEDYQRLQEAAERADAPAVEQAGAALEARIKACAKDIRDKYIAPPHTTDFAFLFLPTEGLYAEVLRRPGLVDGLQRDLRVVVAGPTTLLAQLNALQMGFRTLAIQKRSQEVWAVLGGVKAEFGKFGEVLAKVKKQLQTASNTIDDAETRTRQIHRKLRDVEELPVTDAERLLGPGLDDSDAPDAAGDGVPLALAASGLRG